MKVLSWFRLSLVAFCIAGAAGLTYAGQCNKCKDRGETNSSACTATSGGSSCPSTTFLAHSKFCGAGGWFDECSESNNANTPYYEEWTYPAGSPKRESTWTAKCNNVTKGNASFSAGLQDDALKMAADAGYNTSTDCTTEEKVNCKCDGGEKTVQKGVTSC